MIRKMWYKLIRFMYDRYDLQLKRDIPQDVASLFTRYSIDLYEVRFNRKVLSVTQVDSVLNTERDMTTLQRIAYKNMLRQADVLEEGYKQISPAEAKLLGIIAEDFVDKPVWKHDPVIPHKSNEVNMKEAAVTGGEVLIIDTPGTYYFEDGKLEKIEGVSDANN